MTGVVVEAWRVLLQSSPWELAAMILAVAYLLFAVKEIIWCWAAAFVSTLIYAAVFLQANLYMDSALQLFYTLMAVYGWTQWRSPGDAKQGLQISTRRASWHGLMLAAVFFLSLVSGALLDRFTEAAFPYLDSLTTWASVLATWMVARKILENWVYWIVIDSVSIYLYIDRGLYLTVVLFALYVGIAFFGLRAWQLKLNNQV